MFKTFLATAFLFLSLISLVKFTSMDDYYMKNDPKIGNILKNLTKYSGVDFLYSRFARSGALGEEKKKETLEEEYIVLKRELDV